MDDEENTNMLETIQQYQKSIIKHSDKGNDDRILYYIEKLYDMDVTVEHLKQTGIGRTMNSLRKYSGSVGVASKAIVNKWKSMVADEEDEQVPQKSLSEVSTLNSPDVSFELPTEKPKVKHEHMEERHSKRDESREKHRRHESSDRNKSTNEEKYRERHSKSHHKKEEKSSHKSSHKDREKDQKYKKHHDKHRKDDKNRYENKRKYVEEKKSSKKIKYESNSSESDDSNRLTVDNISICSMDSDDGINYDPDPIEDVQSPVFKEKKHKHEKRRDSEKEKVEINGSSKKSSHKHEEKSEKRSKKSSKDSKTSSNKSKNILINNDNGIDSGSGASFAEALGMIEPTSKSVKKKIASSASPTPSTSTLKSSKSPSSSSKPRTESPLSQNPNLLSPLAKLEPLDNSIVSQLPEITTNYKPLGLNYDASPLGNVKHMSAEEALSVVISSKTQRTKVFSGNKTNWGYVPSLFQICVRILQDNIDALEYTGGVPYEILKPVLERATATQLLNTEYYNPYLVEEDDELWELHCRRECKGMKRQELETWREMYLRCRDERETKLKMLTVNIKQSIDKSVPVRQTKLAYVDSFVKPPRAVARKQAKYGTSNDSQKRPLITPTQRLNSIASSSGGEKVLAPNHSSRAVSSSASVIKPKKAPLMQKTLALLKGRFGRR